MVQASVTIDAPDLTTLDLDASGLAVDDSVADLLFRTARSVNTFTDEPVADEQVRAAYDLLRWGPTAMNTSPLRLLLVRSPEARERLAAHMAEGNRDRVLADVRAEGVEVQIGTYALNRLGAYAGRGSFPGADRVFERALALPFHTRLTESDLDRVAEVLDKVVSHH